MNKWYTALSTGQGPCPRSAHAMSFVRLSKVREGYSLRFIYSNCLSFLTALMNRGSTESRDLLIVFGGWNGSRTLNDVFGFDCQIFRWVKIVSNSSLHEPTVNALFQLVYIYYLLFLVVK